MKSGAKCGAYHRRGRNDAFLRNAWSNAPSVGRPKARDAWRSGTARPDPAGRISGSSTGSSAATGLQWAAACSHDTEQRRNAADSIAPGPGRDWREHGDPGGPLPGGSPTGVPNQVQQQDIDPAEQYLRMHLNRAAAEQQGIPQPPLPIINQ